MPNATTAQIDELKKQVTDLATAFSSATDALGQTVAQVKSTVEKTDFSLGFGKGQTFDISDPKVIVAGGVALLALIWFLKK